MSICVGKIIQTPLFDPDFNLVFDDSDLYEYVDTKLEDNFIYPINFKSLANGLGISGTEMWEKDISELNLSITFLDSIPNHVLEKVRNNKAKIL